MVSFYKLRIKLKKMALEEVPEKWREAVEAALAES